MAKVDDAVIAIRDYLIAQWDARIATLNAGPAPQGALLALGADTVQSSGKATYVGERSLTQVPNFPAVYILPDRSSVASWKATTPVSDDLTTHRLEIGILVIDSDPEALARLTTAYMEDVIWWLLKAGHADAGIGFRVGTAVESGSGPEFEWGPVRTREGDQFIQDATLRVDVSPLTVTPWPVAYDPACTLTTDITAITNGAVYTSTSDPIAQWDVIQIDSELIVAAGVIPASNVLAIGRGYNGTTPAAHTAGAAILKAGRV